MLALHELGRRYFAEAQATSCQLLRLCREIAAELVDDGATEEAVLQCRVAAEAAADAASALAQERAEQARIAAEQAEYDTFLASCGEFAWRAFQAGHDVAFADIMAVENARLAKERFEAACQARAAAALSAGTAHVIDTWRQAHEAELAAIAREKALNEVVVAIRKSTGPLGITLVDGGDGVGVFVAAVPMEAPLSAAAKVFSQKRIKVALGLRFDAIDGKDVTANKAAVVDGLKNSGSKITISFQKDQTGYLKALAVDELRKKAMMREKVLAKKQKAAKERRLRDERIEVRKQQHNKLLGVLDETASPRKLKGSKKEVIHDQAPSESPKIKSPGSKKLETVSVVVRKNGMPW